MAKEYFIQSFKDGSPAKCKECGDQVAVDHREYLCRKCMD